MSAAIKVLCDAGRQLREWRADELLVFIVFVLVIAGCAQAPVVPERVEIPVPVACAVEQPARPDWPTDAAIAALDDFRLPVWLAIERRQRQIYEAELEASVAGCWKPTGGAGGT